ncbi:MAG: hypothetical protein ABI865_15405 [Nitrosospira sp.]
MTIISPDVKEIFAHYWCTYGGWSALIKSSYLHVAIFFLIPTCNFWLNEEWWDQSILVLPNMLGFSLAGFAMFLALGDEKFREMLTEVEEQESSSLYVSLCASFVHFILIQLLALACAILASSLDFYLPWPADLRGMVDACFALFGALGYLLFLYSLTSMMAATMAIFRTSSWYELHRKNEKHMTTANRQKSGSAKSVTPQ